MTNPAELIRGAILERIQVSPVRAEWSASSEEPFVSLRLPYNCKFGGTLWTHGDGGRNFSFDPLSVPHNLRRNGIATRLVRALTHVALTIPDAYERYGGSVSSPHMVGILGNIFGLERLDFESGDYMDSDQLASDEATELLRAGGDVIVAIDLAGLNPHDFEAPIFAQDRALPV